ncbi:hypothetical protein pb186bvf_012727 [Paramecium bursaria]
MKPELQQPQFCKFCYSCRTLITFNLERRTNTPINKFEVYDGSPNTQIWNQAANHHCGTVRTNYPNSKKKEEIQGFIIFSQLQEYILDLILMINLKKLGAKINMLNQFKFLEQYFRCILISQLNE